MVSLRVSMTVARNSPFSNRIEKVWPEFVAITSFLSCFSNNNLALNNAARSVFPCFLSLSVTSDPLSFSSLSSSFISAVCTLYSAAICLPVYCSACDTPACTCKIRKKYRMNTRKQTKNGSTTAASIVSTVFMQVYRAVPLFICSDCIIST